MKKSVYILFLLTFCLFLTGCGKEVEINSVDMFENNAFRIVRQTSSGGKIALSHIFPLGSEQMKEQAFSEKEIQTYRFYLTTYVNALAKTNKQKEIEGVEVGSCVYFTDVDGLGFTIIFENLSVQKKFFGVEEGEDNGGKSQQKNSGFFMKKTEICTIFPVSSTLSADNLRTVNLLAISAWCKDNNISDERKKSAEEIVKSAIFIYDFAINQAGLKSENMYESDGLYHNVFVKTYQQIAENNQIKFWTIQPNRPVWYGSALVVVLCGMGLGWIILKKKKEL